jgi:riboflavin-specific deaminase-like protein
VHLIWPTAGAASSGSSDVSSDVPSNVSSDGHLDEDALIRLYAPDRTKPSVRLNFVTSLDGAVTVAGYSRGLSGEADQMVFDLLRVHADAIMVAAGTLRHEGYGPMRVSAAHANRRTELGLAEQPTLVVVSSALDLSPDSAVFTAAPTRAIVLTHCAAPAERRKPLEAVADVISCGDTAVDLAAGLGVLHERGLGHVLCEGGPQLFGALLASDLVDELCLTISPLLVGPGPGRIVAGPLRPEPLGLRPVHVITADGALLTRYARPT